MENTTQRERVVIISTYNTNDGPAMRYCIENGVDCVAHYYPNDEYLFATAEECLSYHDANRIVMVD